jgi:nitrite reductase/ring-hydroxylating ferredoxin subunit
MGYQPNPCGRTLCIRQDPHHEVDSHLRRQDWRLHAKSPKEKNEEDKDPNLFPSFGDFFASSSSSSSSKDTPTPPDNDDDESRGWFSFPDFSKKESPKATESDADTKRSRTQAVRDALKRITFQTPTNTTDGTTTTKTTKSKLTKEQRREKKQQQRKEVKAEKRIQKQETKKQSQESETDDTIRFSVLKRITDLLPFGNTTTPIGETIKEESKKNLPNPLSVVKDFAGVIWKNEPKEEWAPVFPKTRIMPGEVKPVTIAGLDLLVIASNDGRSLYCIENSCPHMGTPLETGRLTRLPIEYKDDVKSNTANSPEVGLILTETDVSNILQQDGCEDCIVCPLHRTAFALKSGEVRGEWCPYPPVLGKVMGQVKPPTSAAVFDVRINGKNVEVRLNSILQKDDEMDRPKTER